jgi:hypothetical protein
VTGVLPAELAAWGPMLASLDPAVAAGMAPMVRGLAELVGRRDAGSGPDGEVDGYAGLSTRGTPERILVSEWLLAAAEPLEFLRRAGDAELLHLDLRRRRPSPQGRVIALVDTGVDQLGAPRLAQLAALIVLHRRAGERGLDLHVGLLTADRPQWMVAAPDRLLRAWLEGRGRRCATPADLARWDGLLQPGDETWLLTGPGLASAGLPGAGLPGAAGEGTGGAARVRRRVLRVEAAGWTAEGVASLRADLDGDVVRLPMPPAARAVQVLRGAGWRRAAGAVSSGGRESGGGSGVAGLRFPTFPGGQRRLVLRGPRPNRLVTVAVLNRPSPAPRPRPHDLPGAAVAAGFAGRRLIALILDDEVLRLHVIGKPLFAADELEVPVAALGTDPESLVAGTADGLPLLRPASQSSARQVYLSLGDTWWCLHGTTAEAADALAVAPPQGREPAVAARMLGDGVRVGNQLVPGSRDAQAVVFGHHGWLALRGADPGTWRLYAGDHLDGTVHIGPSEQVLAVVERDRRPLLALRSTGGLILRLAGPDSTTTLTRWSGGVGPPAIHPTEPLIAVQRAPDLIEIGDLHTGTVHQVVHGAS